ncbi:MAG: aminopeptidase [Archangium sp.]|nr:aminopeptidase [Archangium sp.]
MKFALCVILFSLSSWAADVPPEVQIALQGLRAGEKARAEAVLGDLALLPLYRGDFQVDVAKRTVKGKYSLTVTAKSALSELVLRASPNVEHAGAVVLSKPKLSGAGKVLLSQPDPSTFVIALEPALKAGESATVEFEFKATFGVLPKDSGGISALSAEGVAGDYGAWAASDDMISLVGLVPMLVPAPNGRPFAPPSGIGDLGTAEPSNLVVSVTVPTGWRVTANGLAMGEVPTGAGTVRFAYAAAVARDMPIFLHKGAKVTTRTSGELEVETILLGNDSKQAAEIAAHAEKAVELLGSKLGPYPYKTLRVVEMRLIHGAGGMEFPGLITVSSGLLAGNDSPLSMLGLPREQEKMVEMMFGPALKQLIKSTLEFTIDHEVAHQWSAMLVGNDPIAEPLADEPLTQHLALLVLEWRNGKAAAQQMRDGQLKATYQMHRMLGGSDGKANRPTSGYDSNREYAALVYGKAPLLFDEQRKVVGDDAWQRGLKTYFEQNRYRFAGTRTLTQVMAKQSPSYARKLEELRVHWWEEEHGDEDIGGYDIDALLNGMGGQSSMPGIDKKQLEEFEKAMKMLSGE